MCKVTFSRLSLFFVFIVGVGVPLLSLAGCSDGSGAKRISVSIVQYVDHPALDACRKGFMDEMAVLGYKEGQSIDIVYENANGDPNLAYAIAEKVASKRPSIVYSLATPMSQAVKRATKGKGVSVVFGAITDPISAGLIKSMKRPGGRITGSSDRWPYKKQLELLKETLPNSKSIGVVFNPGEDNTRYAMAQTRRAAKELALILVEAPITNAAEVFEAAQSIAGKCDAFYVPADNTAMASAGAIIKVANSHNKPVVAGDPETFKQGCLVGLGVSYRNLGINNARQVDSILKGEVAGNIPVFVSKRGSVMVNLKVAKKLNLGIPKSVIDKADEKVGE